MCQPLISPAGTLPGGKAPMVLVGTRLSEVRGFSDFFSEFFTALQGPLPTKSAHGRPLHAPQLRAPRLPGASLPTLSHAASSAMVSQHIGALLCAPW